MAKRQYKQNRAKARSAWDTYSDYYDKVTKRNPEMYFKKYTKAEFEEEYLNAKDAGWTNPAISLVRDQRKWDYQFSRRYKSLTGTELTGRETKAERKQIFIDFVEDEFGGDYQAGREFFQTVMY